MSHTPACIDARAAHPAHSLIDETPDWPIMSRLDEHEQQAVLECPDPSHESTRLHLRGRPWIPPWKRLLG